MVKKKSKVSKKEEISIEYVEPTKVDDGLEEPSWYHYIIIFLGIVGIFLFFYFTINFFYVDSNQNIDLNNSDKEYVYPFKHGNITINLKLNYPLSYLENLDYNIEPNKLDIINTVNFTYYFQDYNGSDNGNVAVSASKLTSYLKIRYGFSFTNNSFKDSSHNITCEDSTNRNKIITFDPYQNSTEIKISENGCIEFLATNSKEIIPLTDKFILELISE